MMPEEVERMAGGGGLIGMCCVVSTWLVVDVEGPCLEGLLEGFEGLLTP